MTNDAAKSPGPDAYAGPEKYAKRDQTTIWRDGEVVRQLAFGRAYVAHPVPPLRESPPSQLAALDEKRAA